MDVALSRQDVELDYFAKEGSIVREIWGKSDTILVIFAGAAAEFALSKAVDWLYFTGRLPSDPLGRLFSTVEYAKRIVFSTESEAFKAIESINLIHQGLEKKRGFNIPDWAYRDVLFMLIDYSIRAYELLERPLKWEERQEVFKVFYKLGAGLNIPDIPTTFEDWQLARVEHMNRNLSNSHFTKDLFQQYKKHLGSFRYYILLELQAFVVPEQVKKLMGLRKTLIIRPLVSVYKISRIFYLDQMMKNLLMPAKYRQQIKGLDHH